MHSPEWARLAGFALTIITGADLDFLDLDADPPECFEAQPNDDPDNEVVDMEDEDLIWPKVEELADWWEKQTCYEQGISYLNGKEKTQANLLENLKLGRQSHRTAAATELALLEPMQTLFSVEAPGFRQLRQLNDV